MGITGKIMNTLYKKQSGTDTIVAKPFINVVSVLLGCAAILFPLGIALAAIITALFS